MPRAGPAIPDAVKELVLRVTADHPIEDRYFADIGVMSVKTLKRARAAAAANGGRLPGRRYSSGRRRKLPPAALRYMEARVLNRPQIYLDEIYDSLVRQGHYVALSTVQRALIRMGYTRKVAHRIAYERDEGKRLEYLVRSSGYSAEQLVFIDETSKDGRTVGRTHARSPRNELAPLQQPLARGQRYSLIAGLTLEGLRRPFVVTGSFNTASYYLYLRDELLPTMNVYPAPASVLVMDNASIHKNEAIQRLIADFGCRALYLSPYSPDFNPIERAWSKVKKRMQREGGLGGPINCIFNATRTVTASDAEGWFRLAGY